jgi:hypothetical protein
MGGISLYHRPQNEPITLTDITIPATTHASPYGIVYKDTNGFIHNFNYGNNGTVTTEGQNTFVGVNAGNFTMGATATSATQASYNSALGASAFVANSTGHDNSALGAYALQANTTGSSNSALGASAGRYLADGTTGNATSGNSLFLGYDTRAASAGDTNEIVIGVSATGAGSNTVTLGNDSIVKTLLKGNTQLNKLLTYASEYDNGNSGAADTIDWNNGNGQKSTLTASCTYTFTAPTSGVTRLQLRVIQGGTGSYTVTWPATVKWQANTAPTLSTAVGSVDIITFWWDGQYYRGVASVGWTA